MAEALQYINNKGENVNVAITVHARKRFLQRWNISFPEKPLTGDILDLTIARYFRNSSRIKKLSKKDRIRLKRYGKDTLFFRTNTFTFIVQSAAIVTIELSDSGKRHLNKPSSKAYLTDKLGDERDLCEEVVVQKPSSYPKFILTALALGDGHYAKYVNLGTYDSDLYGGCPYKLQEDEGFRHEMKRRFTQKRPTWRLVCVYAKSGKKGERVEVLDENFDLITQELHKANNKGARQNDVTP